MSKLSLDGHAFFGSIEAKQIYILQGVILNLKYIIDPESNNPLSDDKKQLVKLCIKHVKKVIKTL